jgi:hypothetical protein
MEESHFTRNDRDLLVAIDTKLELMIKSNSDHEMRIRRLELWGAISIGLAYALQFYFNFLRH